MTKPIEELLSALSHRLTETHKVAVDEKDPLLMTLTATLMIVEEAIKAGGEAQKQELNRHAGELEVLTTRWTRHVEVTALAILDKVKSGTLEAAHEVVERAGDEAVAEVRELLAAHARQMRVLSWTASLAVAMAVMAAAFVVVR